MAFDAKTNGTLSAISVFTLIGSALNWAGYAQTAKDLFDLAQSDFITFNWPAIFTLTFFISTGLLIFGNGDFFIRKYEKNKRSKKRFWNQSAGEALHHIVKYSSFGKSLGRRDQGERYKICMQALYESAKAGRVRFAGMKDGSQILVEIKKSELESLIPAYGQAFELCQRDGKIVYYSVMVERELIHAVWP